MKKKISVFLAFVMIVSVLINVYPNVTNAAKETINVNINGKIDNYQKVSIKLNDKDILGNVPGILYKGTTMVPIRVISENLGAEVSWNEVTNEVEVKKDSKKIVVKIGSIVGTVNGTSKNITGGNPPILADSSTLVPIRFLSEELGFSVDWNGITNTALLKTVVNNYKLIQNDEEIGVYYSLSKAVLEGVKWDSSKVEKSGTIIWRYEDHIKSYVVYQDYDYLGMYDNISDAITEGLKWSNSKVEKDGKKVWDFNIFKKDFNLYQNNIYINSFSSFEVAVSEATKISNSKIEKDGKIVWNPDLGETGYKVYQGTALLGIFSSLTEAIKEGQKWSGSTILKNDETVWEFGKNKLIVIDPGHGGSDPGAISFSGYAEKKLTLSVALKLGDELKKMGYIVEYTRTTDVYVGLSERANIGNRLNADGFISIHFNSASASTATGIETYYSPKTGVKQTYDYNFANAIQKRLIEATGQSNRGTKSANYVVTKESKKYAALVELGFINNPMDEIKLISTDYHIKTAKAIADGVEDFF